MTVNQAPTNWIGGRANYCGMRGHLQRNNFQIQDEYLHCIWRHAKNRWPWGYRGENVSRGGIPRIPQNRINRYVGYQLLILRGRYTRVCFLLKAVLWNLIFLLVLIKFEPPGDIPRVYTQELLGIHLVLGGNPPTPALGKGLLFCVAPYEKQRMGRKSWESNTSCLEQEKKFISLSMSNSCKSSSPTHYSMQEA